jgi:hypothetical protein
MKIPIIASSQFLLLSTGPLFTGPQQLALLPKKEANSREFAFDECKFFNT